MNALGALGKTEALRNVRQREIQALESAAARGAGGRARADPARRTMPTRGAHDDAMREANLAMLLRPNEATVLYNAACTFCLMNKKAEALDALAKAWPPASRTPTGRAATPTSRCSTATRSSRSCTREGCGERRREGAERGG